MNTHKLLAASPRLVRLAVLCSAAIGASAMATEYGRVISATPITSQVSVPQQVCHDEQQVVRAPSTGAGAVIGAIAGGILGHTVGAGDGRILATGVGAIAGSVIGDHVENSDRQATTQMVRRCGTAYTTQNQVVGYQVEYEYAGQRYTTQTQSNPGRRIALNVQVQPVDEQQGYAVEAQPVQSPPVVYEQPAPVYAQPAYYAAPVAIRFGWYGSPGYYHHHDWH